MPLCWEMLTPRPAPALSRGAPAEEGVICSLRVPQTSSGPALTCPEASVDIQNYTPALIWLFLLIFRAIL